MMFASRAAAGRALAKHIDVDRDRRLQTLALSRDAIGVAAHVAACFGAEIEVLCTKHSAIAAVVEGARPRVDLERVIELGLHASDVTAHLIDLRAAIARMIELYRGARPFPNIYDRHVLIVDDGFTPAHVLAEAVAHLRALGAGRMTIALPACSSTTLELLRGTADDVACIAEAAPRGVAFTYADTDSLGDVEALTLLARSRLAAARVRSVAGCPYRASRAFGRQ
jgi:predicted phosphoribosyltransferase